MWLTQVFCVIYFTAVCAAEDPQDEPPVPSLQLLSTWLDVFPSEKVEFRCGIAGSSDWSFTWKRNQEQVEASDPNVSLFTDGSNLTVTAADPNYSGSYSCKGQHKTNGIYTADSAPLQLRVQSNKPRPAMSQKPNFNKMFPGESVTFTCTVRESSGWEYLWFHDGKEIHASSSIYTINPVGHPNKGQYHCQAKRGKIPFYSEESTPTVLQVSDPPTPSLKLQTSWLDVFEEENVAFSCEVGISDWTFTWYRNKEELQADSELTIDDEGTLLNITSVNKAHGGVYACKAYLETRNVTSGFSNTAAVTVYDNTPKPTLHKVPVSNPMYVGETVNFTCNVDVSSGWEYQWYKDGYDLPATSKSNAIRLDLSNVGKYSCKATRGKIMSTDISEEMQLDVLKIPVSSLKQMTPWLDVFPEESVQLKCETDQGTGWTYTWSRDEREVKADSVVSFDLSGSLLSIKSASAAHKGQYKCKGHLKERSVSSNSSSGLTLTVYDKKPSVILTQDPDYKVMFSGESVSFSCHINVSSGWELMWYKDEKELSGSKTRYHNISVSTATAGSYNCRAKRGTAEVFHSNYSQTIHLQVKENKPKPLMTQQPNVDKVYVGESVSFECKVEASSGWEYFWYKNETQYIRSSRFTINATLSDNGVYKCQAVRDKTLCHTEFSDERTLLISEIPVPLGQLKTPWLDVFPTESVKLSCGMDGSSDWMYTWYKDKQKVQPADTTHLDSDGTTLFIDSTSVSHRGRYSCLAKLKSRSVDSSRSSELTLNVYDTKPRVTLTRTPTYNVTHTGDLVSFHCHINVSSEWEYMWYKDNRAIVESGNNHTITSVAIKNTGSYQCQVKRGREAVFLSDPSEAVNINVLERPQANIILLTGWSEVFSTDSLVLKCGVQDSQDTWNYTWFKEDKQINHPPSEKHTVTPQDNPEQSQYTCRGNRDGRPSYSKTSQHFMTKNLLLKRRVLLSISGCIFFGIIAVFLGCIILRVFHKPADDDDRPEEADLFLTMAQQKGADVPCPLVEYITDATLNASSKEVEENGTICSETTPLPITSQEDQDVKTESHDTAKNNGGLVSFMQ
ncbi:obscurin [Labrus mixtus]|uniref:obscurin n=1 Tax=Labrus mixtus TaxID=508554 RepID=UPI0029BFAC7C|nr:obscurin [Labrus mixtus]